MEPSANELQIGLNFVNKHAFTNALEYFDKLLIKYPKASSPHLYNGLIYLEMGRYHNAHHCLLDYLVIHPRHCVSWLGLLVAYVSINKKEFAMRCLTRLLACGDVLATVTSFEEICTTSFAKILNQTLSVAFLELMEYLKSNQLYKENLQLCLTYFLIFPENKRVFNYYIFSSLNLDKARDALDFFSKVIAETIKPKKVTSEIDNAYLSCFTRAIKSICLDVKYYIVASQCYCRLDQAEEASELFHSKLGLLNFDDNTQKLINKEWSNVLQLLAAKEWKNKNYSRAEKYYCSANDIDPNNVAVRALIDAARQHRVLNLSSATSVASSGSSTDIDEPNVERLNVSQNSQSSQ